MKEATRIEFQDRPPIYIGSEMNKHSITKIEVHHSEYEDHSEMVVLILDNDFIIAKLFQYPCIIFFK